MGYYDTYLAKQNAKGDFKIGDRVRILPQYKGKTYAAKQKRSGEWILKEFKTANWVLKRPDDYTGYHTQGLLAKSHMLEKVEPKITVGPTESPTGLKPHDPPLQSMPPTWMAQGSSASKKIEELSKPQVDVQVYRPGMVVLIKHPDGTHKGLHTITEYGNSQLTWVAVAPLFGGVPTTVKTEYIMVIPEKDLTITYLPQ